MEEKKQVSVGSLSLLSLVVLLILAYNIYNYLNVKSETSDSKTTNDYTLDVSTHDVSSEQSELGMSENVLSLVGFGESGALIDENLSIADMLVYSIQDEYLAHDEYELIMSEYGNITPYSNIVKAELNHIDLLEQLYEIYKLPYPSLETKDYLVMPDSLLEAAETGVTAEINNIAMYEIFLANELPENIREVFEELMAGSVKHLNSFNNQVEKYN